MLNPSTYFAVYNQIIYKVLSVMCSSLLICRDMALRDIYSNGGQVRDINLIRMDKLN